MLLISCLISVIGSDSPSGALFLTLDLNHGCIVSNLQVLSRAWNRSLNYASANDRGIITSQNYDTTSFHMSIESLQTAIISFNLDVTDLYRILISVN